MFCGFQGVEFIEFLQNKYLPTLQIAPGLIQVGASLSWMVYRSTLFVGSSSFVFQVEIRIWSVFFFVEGDGERKPLEQHQIKHICNARSGNQTGTLSPSRHPCPPPGKYPQTSPPLAPRNNLPNTTFVFYLRTLPLNIMPPTSI